MNERPGVAMRVDVITLFPEFVAGVGQYGVTGRAVENGLLHLVTWNPRDDAADRHRTVDDRAYGGGPGMVMKVEPLRTTLRRARDAVADEAGVIYLSPQGRPLTQPLVESLATRSRLILLCGRYEGIDERLVAAEVDEEISVGDYVLSGGELPAMTVIDAIARLLPGALGHADSAQEDSFTDGLLDHPHYTRPDEIDGQRVPSVLLGGDHQAIARWRRKQALGRTWLRRPDLLKQVQLDDADRRLLDEFVAEHQAHRNSPVDTGRG